MALTLTIQTNAIGFTLVDQNGKTYLTQNYCDPVTRQPFSQPSDAAGASVARIAASAAACLAAVQAGQSPPSS